MKNLQRSIVLVAFALAVFTPSLPAQASDSAANGESKPQLVIIDTDIGDDIDDAFALALEDHEAKSIIGEHQKVAHNMCLQASQHI